MKGLKIRKNPFSGGLAVVLDEPICNKDETGDPHEVLEYLLHHSAVDGPDYVELEAGTSRTERGYDYRANSFEKSLSPRRKVSEFLRREKERYMARGYEEYTENGGIQNANQSGI